MQLDQTYQLIKTVLLIEQLVNYDKQLAKVYFAFRTKQNRCQRLQYQLSV